MEYELFSFRHAVPVLEGRPAWYELQDVLEGIRREDIIATQTSITAARNSAPKGGQTAVNAVIRDRLASLGGWTSEPRLFVDPALNEWKMDFLKDGVGVEVSFNHAEAIAWQFTRLTIAGESPRVREGGQIEVGVTVVADRSLKAWSRMDGAVGTFDVAKAWLAEMRPILPIPILLVGLKASGWASTDVFPGTVGASKTK